MIKLNYQNINNVMLDEHQYMYEFLGIVFVNIGFLIVFLGGRVSGLIFSSRFALFSYLYQKICFKIIQFHYKIFVKFFLGVAFFLIKLSPKTL